MNVQGALSRGLEILGILASSQGGLPLAAIAEQVDMPKSGVHRTLQILIAEDYVSQDPDSGHYRLTLSLPVLGLQYLSLNSVTSLATPLLDSLAASTGQLVRLAVSDGDRLVWVAKRQGSRSGLRFDPDHAADVPLASTATGLAWLSHLPDDEAIRVAVRSDVPLRHPAGPNLPVGIDELVKTLDEVRSQGWATVHDSYELGISAIAMAVAAPDAARPVGVVSVAGPSIQLTSDRIREIAPSLRSVVAQLERVPVAMMPQASANTDREGAR